MKPGDQIICIEFPLDRNGFPLLENQIYTVKAVFKAPNDAEINTWENGLYLVEIGGAFMQRRFRKVEAT